MKSVIIVIILLIPLLTQAMKASKFVYECHYASNQCESALGSGMSLEVIDSTHVRPVNSWASSKTYAVPKGTGISVVIKDVAHQVEGGGTMDLIFDKSMLSGSKDGSCKLSLTKEESCSTEFTCNLK